MGDTTAALFSSLTPVVFTVILLATAVSTFLQFVTGFGYAIIMVAVLPLVMPLGDAVLLTLISVVSIGVWLIWDCRHDISVRHIPMPAFFASSGAVAGLFLMGIVAPSLYLRILGLLLVVLAIWFMRFAARTSIAATPLSGAIAGIISGLCGALFAIAGPPMVLYFNAVSPGKKSYMGTLQTVMLIQGVIAIGGRLAMGGWTPGMGPYLIPCVIGAVLGAVPGKYLFGRIDSAKLKQIIYIFMCVSGIYIAVTA